MKFYDLSIIIIVAIVVTAAVVGIVSSKMLGPDNPVEEVAEEVIQAETGLKIDLSPETSAPDQDPSEHK